MTIAEFAALLQAQPNQSAEVELKYEKDALTIAGVRLQFPEDQMQLMLDYFSIHMMRRMKGKNKPR